MVDTESTETETTTDSRSSAMRDLWFRVVVVVCMIVATVSVAVIALEQRAQTKCSQASANADAWVAVNVVARDFNKEVSLEQNKAAVTNIDKRLRACLPGGR